MQRTKNLLFSIGLLCASVLFSLGLVEIILRTLPVSVTGVERGLTYVPDPRIAYHIMPNSTTKVVGACFTSEVSVNSKGFRGGEWEQRGGIAILGDSFMEAIQVQDDQLLAHRISEELDMPVYNTGLSSFGTVAELITYRTYVREQKPSVVVLSLYGNDVLDNHCDTSRQGAFITKPCAEHSKQELAINQNYYSMRSFSPLRVYAKEYCYTCRLVQRFVARQRSAHTVTTSYVEQNENMLAEAWDITEKALRMLASDVEADGAHLVVMAIPSQAEFIGTANTEATSAQLAALSRRLEIPTVSLLEPMRAYADAHDLKDPYFAHECDGHWSALGHEVAAYILAEYLLSEGFVTNSSRVSTGFRDGA